MNVPITNSGEVSGTGVLETVQQLPNSAKAGGKGFADDTFAELLLLHQANRNQQVNNNDEQGMVLVGLTVVPQGQNQQVQSDTRHGVVSSPIVVAGQSPEPFAQIGNTTQTPPVTSGLPVVPEQGPKIGTQSGKAPDVTPLPTIPGGQHQAIIGELTPRISIGEVAFTNMSLVATSVGPGASRQAGKQIVPQSVPFSSASIIVHTQGAVLQGTKPASSATPTVPTKSAVSAASLLAKASLTAATTNVPGPISVDPMMGQPRMMEMAQNFGSDTNSFETTPKQASSIVSSSSTGSAQPATLMASSKIGAEAITKFAARLASRVANGSSKFEMRIDPPQMGRIEVKLELTSDNRVQAVLTADRPEVLQDLQKGADSLRRALIQEGFDLDSNDLEFQLNQNADGSDPQGENQPDLATSRILENMISETLAHEQIELDSGNGYWLIPERRIDITA